MVKLYMYTLNKLKNTFATNRSFEANLSSKNIGLAGDCTCDCCDCNYCDCECDCCDYGSPKP